MSGRVTYRIDHGTRYVHDGLASTSQHVACLKPRTLGHQRVVWHDLTIDPAPAAIRERIDYFGNHVTQFAILAPYTEMRVLSRSEVELQEPAREVDLTTSPAWESVRESLLYRGGAPFQAASEFSYPSPYAAVGAALDAFARRFFEPGCPVLAAAVDLMHAIHDEFTFDPAATSVATPVSEVLANRRGVCQDFAHLFIAALRSLGLPARYVSGYLLTDAPEGQPRLVGADASHAWVAVWCPVHGWVDLDPTNDVMPSMRHITLAWGRDYGDVSPLHGVVLGGQEHRLKVEVSVYPLSA
jgi:transglutaminase-like putative cysteine protease